MVVERGAVVATIVYAPGVRAGTGWYRCYTTVTTYVAKGTVTYVTEGVTADKAADAAGVTLKIFTSVPKNI